MKKILVFLLGIFLISLVSGGLLESDWKTCLKENCNSFCIEYGMDGGEYSIGECLCKDYKQTSTGEFVIKEEKIQIEECGGYEDKEPIVFWIVIVTVNAVLIIAIIYHVKKSYKSPTDEI